MLFKKAIGESLRIFIPLVVFLILTIYLLTSDPGIVGPY